MCEYIISIRPAIRFLCYKQEDILLRYIQENQCLYNYTLGVVHNRDQNLFYEIDYFPDNLGVRTESFSDFQATTW